MALLVRGGHAGGELHVAFPNHCVDHDPSRRRRERGPFLEATQ